MVLKNVVRLPELAVSAPGRVLRAAGEATSAALDVADEAVGLGRRAAATGVEAGRATLESTGRLVRDAFTKRELWWRAGHRLHLPVRLPEDAPEQVRRVLEDVVAAVLEHPGVVSAYWDGGLARVVVRFAEDAATDRVAAEVSALAREYEPSPASAVEPAAHPGDLHEIRSAAVALAVTGAGLATSLAAGVFRLRRPPRVAAAALTVVREDPRVRSLLRSRLGGGPTEVAIAAATAAVHGFGGSPTELLLDAALRTGQLLDAAARVTAFERVHDVVCVPGRESVAGEPVARPALVDPVTRYATSASTGGLVGALVTGVLTGGVREASEAVLAGSPKPSRYGWTGYASVLGQVLARDGVLVRAPERLRSLQTVDTLLVHAGALRLDSRTVTEAHPHAPDWGDGRLWEAAEAALAAADSGSDPDADPDAVRLRPVPDAEADSTGLMIASADGRDVGTVLVGHRPDPVARAVLDAAGQAGLRVVVVGDDGTGANAVGADETVCERSMAEVLRSLRADGRVVCALARPRGTTGADADVVAGVLAADFAVCLADQDAAVVWAADALCVDGLAGVWRLVRAIPAARAAGKYGATCAQAATALSGLLVATSQQRRWGRLLSPVARLSPVDLAAGAALVSGWALAAGVGTAPTPAPRPLVPWHALPAEGVLHRLREQSGRGRQVADDLTARARHLGARLAGMPGAGPPRELLRLAGAVRTELADPLTPVLAVGAVASAVLGSTVDALLVVGVMGVNALVGGGQRLRAERALAALAVTQRQRARVVGERRTEVVDADGLAPGHVIELRGGDVVPADARLLEVDSLEVDESALTGESLPVTKESTATPAAAIADRRCMVFEGTTVVAGWARAVVVGTGADTEAGRAVSLASRTAPPAGVQARLRELTGKALPMTLVGGAAVTGFALLRGRPVREAIGGGVAVAVAAVPEGLPLVATVAQTAAARRLGKHGILVRTARTLEALGRVDTVCFDKTGTLTENRLRVVEVATADGVFPVDAPEATAVLEVAARACPRQPTESGAHEHATDEAVLSALPEDSGWEQLAGLPFEASRGYAAAVGRTGDDTLLVVKGAPEVVLPGCAAVPADTGELVETLASAGLRVLAVARRPVAADDADEVLDEPLAELEFQGLLALADTPRDSAEPLVRSLREAGVAPVVLTGDHPRTARAIAVGLGWPEDTKVVTGGELAALDRAGGARLLRGAGVVARVAPEQKLQVVEALRAAGRVVAMVGDGANDAAAIRAADVGIGIAARGSAAARNAADLVLTDDDLGALVGAVAEGRALWRSVADAIGILIGGNAGEVGFTVLGTMLSGTCPLSTRQLLLVNLLTDMFPAMAVAVTPARDEAGGEEAPVGAAVLGGPLITQIRHRGIITGLGATTGWLIGKWTPGTARRTSTMALCGLVGSQLVQTLSGRRHSPLVLATTLGSAAALVAVVQTPGVSHFFGCTPLGPVAWAGVGAAMGTAAVGPVLVPPLEAVVSRAASRLPAVRFTSGAGRG
ncbi:cation-translocating P-type ATPase [Actinokineospora spheciospongiae]|uniref:cation-translocating P-type ATPase n=1 Tax=Actinokineospora spheciospongiae TaxID=909613 RepID=UPI000DA02A46|nr:cation-translocating P-type ATPase [Actinokineospora spheciospongiae]PWW66640.1 cation-transporting ATPase I [Actinokineospora spheciospongiae]